MKPHQLMAGFGALLMAIAIALGAVGAHVLEGALKKSDTDPVVITKALDRWDVGVRYQMVEATLLILGGITVASTGRSMLVTIASALSIVAIVLFSGGLYAAAITGNTTFIHIVPYGGMCAIFSWIVFAGRLFVMDNQTLVIDKP